MGAVKPASGVPAPGQAFVRELLNWNSTSNDRQMPWKGEKDPYRIWLSEVILQQTRVEQGLKYYQNFISTFPDVHSLGAAPEELVLKTWEGLGYYTRCRNLIATARYISGSCNGVFPSDFDSILALKGVGPYTAAAIASFAFNLPHAVLDGNVFRVLSRIFDNEIPVDSTAGKQWFGKRAQEMLPAETPGVYNQAIMDFGATICKPVPECRNCFFNKECRSYLAGTQDLLPVKGKKILVKNRWFNYFFFQYKDEIAVHQRKGKDIWQELFEFPMIETKAACTATKLTELLRKQYATVPLKLINETFLKQKLTHQTIHFHILHFKPASKKGLHQYQWIRLKELDRYPFPKTLRDYLKQQS